MRRDRERLGLRVYRAAWLLGVSAANTERWRPATGYWAPMRCPGTLGEGSFESSGSQLRRGTTRSRPTPWLRGCERSRAAAPA